MKKATFLLGLCLVVLAATSPLRALEPLARPSGPVVLTLGGAITVTNAPGVANFDRAMLEQFSRHAVRTDSPWTDGESLFEGFLLADLLRRVGAEGSELRAEALNDYAALIPVEQAEGAGLILATHQDGQVMRVRDRGPFWIIYPWSERPDLRGEENYARAVWQLRHIEVLP